jgi:hypothetical protein
MGRISSPDERRLVSQEGLCSMEFVSYSIYYYYYYYYYYSTGNTTLVGFRPAQLSLSILSRKVLQIAVASGTSNPQLGEEPGI